MNMKHQTAGKCRWIKTSLASSIYIVCGRVSQDISPTHTAVTVMSLYQTSWMSSAHTLRHNKEPSWKVRPTHRYQTFCLFADNVMIILSSLNPRCKAAEPDYTPSCVFRECIDQLASVWSSLKSWLWNLMGWVWTPLCNWILLVFLTEWQQSFSMGNTSKTRSSPVCHMSLWWQVSCCGLQGQQLEGGRCTAWAN